MEISKQVEQQGQDFAKEVMSMNRQQRRAFTKKNKTDKIYGSNVPIRNVNNSTKKTS